MEKKVSLYSVLNCGNALIEAHICERKTKIIKHLVLYLHI